MESEWILSMYPTGRRLSISKASFEAAVRSNLLEAYSMEVTTVMYGRLSTDHRADV